MGGKITAWGMLKEALSLMWRSKPAVLGFLVVETVLVAAYAVLGLDDADVVRRNMDAVSAGPVVIGSLLLGLVAMFTYMFYIHYMVTAWRGAPELVPQGFLGRFLRMVWTAIKIGLVSLLLTLLAAIPFFAVAVAVPGGLKGNVLVLAPAVVAGLAAFAFLVVALIRLDLAIPGVVAGEGTTLREAWRMSRGYGGRIFLSMLLLMLVSFAFGLVVGAPVILVSGLPLTPASSLPIYVCQALFGLLGSTLLCVWYVRLCAGPEPAAPEAPKVEGLAEKVGEGYYGR